MSGEGAETYLRQFAEAQLRRLAGGEASAADCASRVDAVAAAFEGTGVLDGERAEAVTGDLGIALAARSPERGTLLHAGRRAQVSALRGAAGFTAIFARPGRQPGPGDVSVVPVSTVLRVRDDGVDEEIYLLSYAETPGRAWLSVAARTTEPRIPRRHASPPSSRNPRVRPTARRSSAPFAGGSMTAVDDVGREYRLSYSGGGGHWYLGRLAIAPAPPPGTAWLEVRCGGQSARLDLTAKPPDAEVTVRPVTASAGEAYLLRRAESLLGRASPLGGLASLAAEVTGLASAVPALRSVGALPDGSPVPGQLAALVERMGGPGRLIAVLGELPKRWADVLDGDVGTVGPGSSGRVAAARLSAVLPEADGVAVHLAGMVTLPGEGTQIFGGLRARSSGGGQSLWLRDDAGGWHSVSLRGWSGSGGSYTFQAAVVPPVGQGVSHVEFYVTGSTTEVLAVIPLTWWTP